MYNVLIADDEPKIRRGIKQWVEETDLPFRVSAEAENGRQALELTLLNKPDLLLVDINMPHGNGLDFIRQVKSILPDSVVIVISGYDNFEYVREAFKQELNASFTDYLTSFRIEKAKELLLLSGDDLKMYQIAIKVGFSSQHYFSRVFRNLEEISPMEFRRKQ